MHDIRHAARFSLVIIALTLAAAGDALQLAAWALREALRRSRA